MGVQVYSLQFVSVECVSCMQMQAEWVQTSEEREAQSMGLKSSTVKIVYELPKVINLPSLWKLIGLNILKAQWICVPAMCGHWISCCSSVPPHTHNAKSYTPDWLAPPRQWAACWVWSVITFFCLSECLSFTVERGWEGERESAGYLTGIIFWPLDRDVKALEEFSWLGFHLCVSGRGCNTCSYDDLTFSAVLRWGFCILFASHHASGFRVNILNRQAPKYLLAASVLVCSMPSKHSNFYWQNPTKAEYILYCGALPEIYLLNGSETLSKNILDLWFS